MKKQQDTNQIIEAAGGSAAVGRLFGISSQAVSAWKKRGIPGIALFALRLHDPMFSIDRINEIYDINLNAKQSERLKAAIIKMMRVRP